MIFPLITEKDIVIREPSQTEHERIAGVRRIYAMFHREECMQLATKEESSLKFDIAAHIKTRLKNNILRQMYPNEIVKAIHEIRIEFCCNPAIPTGVARDLEQRLRELSAALRPTAL